jgi:hypothetical protein
MNDQRRNENEHEAGAPLPESWMDAARAYNDPPGTPSDEMWRGIEARLPGTEGAVVSLADARARRARRSPLRWLGPAVAAAAVLVVGIGIGRLTAPAGEGPVGPVARAAVEGEEGSTTGLPSTPSPAVRAATFEHLGRSESLLALVRADARSGRLEGDVGQWGRGLLAETRLLLNSPAADDPAMRELLEDLELILAQVAVLHDGGGPGAERAREELEIIARGLEERDVLSRIQAVLPAGPDANTWGI